jgi:hypothetical protein
LIIHVTVSVSVQNCSGSSFLLRGPRAYAGSRRWCASFPPASSAITPRYVMEIGARNAEERRTHAHGSQTQHRAAQSNHNSQGGEPQLAQHQGESVAARCAQRRPPKAVVDAAQQDAQCGDLVVRCARTPLQSAPLTDNVRRILEFCCWNS